MRLKDNVIAQARTRQGWTQEHLASVAGVSTRTIQRVEATGIASADTAQALCAVLDLNFAEIGNSQQIKNAAIALSIPALVCALLIALSLGLFWLSLSDDLAAYKGLDLSLMAKGSLEYVRKVIKQRLWPFKR